MDKVKNAIYRGQVRTVEDAIETWKGNYEEAKKIRDIEDIISQWRILGELLVTWKDSLWERARTGTERNLLETGCKIKDQGYRPALELFLAINAGIEWAESRGYGVDGADDFRALGKKIQNSEREFQAKWPWPDQEEIEAGLESFQRGEGVDLGEWIHELQGKNCETAARK